MRSKQQAPPHRRYAWVLVSCGVLLLALACGQSGIARQTCNAPAGEDISLDPFCVRWTDDADPDGYRVQVTYPNSGESFIYQVGGGFRAFEFPSEAGPIVGPPGECLPRSNVVVDVLRIVEGVETRVGGGAVSIECAGSTGS